MFRKLSVLAVPLAAFLAINAYAGQANPAKAAAQEIVDDYKKLRAMCSVSIGEERRDCFAKLNDSNATYRAAKETLNRDSDDSKSAHFVSFSG